MSYEYNAATLSIVIVRDVGTISCDSFKGNLNVKNSFSPGFGGDVRSEPSCDVDSSSTTGNWLGVGVESTLGFRAGKGVVGGESMGPSPLMPVIFT